MPEDEPDYCCRCGGDMPASVADWWLDQDGYYCTEECADAHEPGGATSAPEHHRGV